MHGVISTRMKISSLTVVALCVLFLPRVLTMQQFIVLPTNETVCNGNQRCITLDQLAVNSTLLFREYDNYTLVFLSGLHVLTHELVIPDIDQLEMCADSSRELTATIDLTLGNLTISNVTSFFLAGLEVITTRVLKDLRLRMYEITLVDFDSIHLDNIKVVVSRKNVNAITAAFVMRSSSLLDCRISFDVVNTPMYLQDLELTSTTLNVTITSRRVQRYGVRKNRGLFYINGCALFKANSVEMHVTADNLPVKLDISDTVVENNSAFASGLSVNLHMEKGSEIEMSLTNSNISYLELEVSAESTLTANVLNSFFTPDNHWASARQPYCMKVTQAKFSTFYFNVHGTTISRCNEGAAVNIQAEQQDLTSIRMNNTLFFLNERTVSIFSSGSALRVKLFKVRITGNADEHALAINAARSKSSIQLIECSFFRNLGYRGTCINFISNHASSLYLTQVAIYENVDLLALYPAIVLAINCNNVTIDSSQFFNNTGTPIEVVLGTVYLSRFVLFKENVARTGGGLSLIRSSLVLDDYALISFERNTALDVGGAIFMSPDLIQDRTSLSNNKIATRVTHCFFSVNSPTSVSLHFRNNSADNGGEDMYGTYLYHRCFASFNPNTILTLSDIRQMFNLENSRNTSLSSISSDPKRVCICDSSGEPQCAKLDFIYLNRTVYPGETFTVPLVVVGEEFGTVTATAHAALLGSTKESLGTGQAAQRTNYRHCTNVEYSVHSSQSTEKIVLTAVGSKPFAIGQLSDDARRRKLQLEYSLNSFYTFNYKMNGEIERQLLITPVYYNITLAKCPLGFELIGDPPSCQCQKELLDNNIRHCTILNHTGYVYRSGTTWVNATYSANRTTSRLIVQKYCPYDYCLSENTSVDLRYPDMQCAVGHSGSLCGGCRDNLSLALGSNRCLDCPNSYNMSLLIFFVVAGFVLVFFIKTLDFTVSKGTINGLIFYANIVWAEQSVLFSNQAIPHKVINVFIAWLNLDFGIETCFAQGLTAYHKAWLQFLFPVYVWCIVGLIILSSHYSTTATKLFGNNSVPVLATLFLMSYAKLLRTVLTVLGYAVLRSTDNAVTVWLYDGNVNYLGLKHAFLFTVAILALLFLWLPYMATLLLVPFLKARSHYRPLRWITKWKPFYDAYFGPFRAKHQYWVGAFLVARVFLFVLFATTSASFPDLNLLVLAILTASLLVYVAFVGPVYKNKYLSLLENSFLLNLTCLAAGVLYQNVVGGEKDLIAYISVSLVFIEFVCITFYHCAVALRNFTNKKNRQRNADTTGPIIRPRRNKKRAFPLREELLESADSQ